MRFQAACLLRCPQTGQPVTLDDFTANMPRGNNVSILLTLIAAPQRQPENAPTMFQAAYWCDVVNQIGSLKKQNCLVFSHAIFYWIDWVSGCLTLLNCLMLLLPPLRPAERSILFSGTSVRLSDDAQSAASSHAQSAASSHAQSAASSHAPKKGCAVREVCASRPARRGRLSFALNLYSLSARADFVFSEYGYKATSQVNSGSINLAWQRGRRVQ